MCHVTLKLAVSRSRPSVPYGANLFVIRFSKFEVFLCTELRNAEPGRTLASARSRSLDNGALCCEVCMLNFNNSIF